MDDRQREQLRKGLSDENLAYVYQGFINYCIGGVKSGIDKSEYDMFVNMTLKKDVTALAHALLSGVFDFSEYWNKLQMIVAWDIMIQGVITGQIKAKGNGDNKDEDGEEILTTEDILDGTIANINLSGDTNV